jgi:hypothetical protein
VLYVLAIENIAKNQDAMEFSVLDITFLLPALNDSNIYQILYQNDTYSILPFTLDPTDSIIRFGWSARQFIESAKNVVDV